MSTITVPIDDLRPNGWNSNVVPPGNEAKLDALIARIGLFKPLIARRVPGTIPELELLGGEHRWESCKRLGMTEVEVKDLGVISDDKAKEISLADNARYGSDDAIRLQAIFDSLTDFDPAAHLPYSDDEIRSISEAVQISAESLDELTLDEDFDASGAPEPAAVKAAKTHTMLRFKVPVRDAEKLTVLIDRVSKRQGFTECDALTNAGDTLVHLLGGLVAE